jgi:hypothetical protein
MVIVSILGNVHPVVCAATNIISGLQPVSASCAPVHRLHSEAPRLSSGGRQRLGARSPRLMPSSASVEVSNSPTVWLIGPPGALKDRLAHYTSRNSGPGLNMIPPNNCD